MVTEWSAIGVVVHRPNHFDGLVLAHPYQKAFQLGHLRTTFIIYHKIKLNTVAEALWHLRWPYAQASGYSRKRCMELSRAPFAFPLLPNSSFHGSKCAQYHITEGY